jgi:integrase
MSRLFESADSFITRKNSEKTRTAYKRALLLFGQMKFGDIPTEEIFLKLNGYIKKSNLQTAIDDIYLFKDHLNKKNMAVRTSRLYIAALQSWFTNNTLQIPKNKSKEIRGNIKPVTDDKAYNLEAAQKRFDQMKSPVARCFFLFLLSTGCRIGEALEVKLSDVNWESHPVTVTIDEATTKTGEGRQVYLTTEAANYIRKIWLTPTNDGKKTQNNRERYIGGARNKAKGLIDYGVPIERTATEDDNRLWPFNRSTAYKFMTTATLRAGFNEKTKTGGLKLHPHSARKFFRTVFGMAAGPDAAETLLGHTPNLTSTYRRLEAPELIKKWAEHESALWINITPEARLAMQNKDIHSTAILELNEKNKKLENELAKIKNFIKMVTDGETTLEKGERIVFF